MSTSQPSAVSIGGPQLPTCTASHASVGTSSGLTVDQRRMSSEQATAFVAPSWRERAKNRPPIRRGNSASPLLAAAGPRSGETANDAKSAVASSCWVMARPSNAVYVA